MVTFYSNLQDRGNCQTTRKSYKTSHIVGWVVGWKKSTDSGAAPPFLAIRFADHPEGHQTSQYKRVWTY
jgi:hypothetical protein